MHLARILCATKELPGSGELFIEGGAFPQAISLHGEESRTVHLILTPEGDASWSLSVSSQPDDRTEQPWTEHMRAQIGRITSPEPDVETFDEITERCTESMSGTEFYEGFWKAGYHLGENFRWLQDIRRRDGEAVARMVRPAASHDADKYELHTGLIDSCFQLICAAFPDGGLPFMFRQGGIYIPFAFQRLVYHRRPEGPLFCHVLADASRNKERKMVEGRVSLFDEQGRPVLTVEGMQLKFASSSALVSRTEKRADDCFYRIDWPATEAESAMDDTSGLWWILADSPELANRLRERGARVVLILRGDAYRKSGTDEYRINPSLREDFDRLLGTTGAPDRVVHCFSLSVSDPGEAKALSSGILHLTQALAKGDSDPSLVFITKGARFVEHGPVAPLQSLAWGFARAIPSEHPEMRVICADLDPVVETKSEDLLHLATLKTDESQVALRNGALRVPRFVRVAPGTGRPSFKSDGAYLVTGASGGLGMLAAKWLAGNGAGRLALMSRSGVRRKEDLEELRSMGAEVRDFRGDVSKKEDVTRILREIGPSLRGIIHAAGTLDDGIILKQTPERVSSVLAPKLAGALNLHDLTAGTNLDFFVLYSSVTSLLASPGQSNYAAANSFLDSFAHYRRSRSLPALSVNWGAWADAGMASEESLSRHYNRRGIERFSPEEGLLALGALIESGLPQASFARINWEAYREQMEESEAPFLEKIPRPAAPSQEKGGEHAEQKPLLDGILGTLPADREEFLREHIREMARRSLGRKSAKDIPTGRPLQEMGFDSLMAVELSNALGKALGRKFSPTLLFDYSSVEALATHLLASLKLDEEDPDKGAKKAA